MVPQVSSLVETFLSVIGTCMSPHIIRECWPLPKGKIPQQDLGGV